MKMNLFRQAYINRTVLILLSVCSVLPAQNLNAENSFHLITRFAATGASDASDPEGYKAYSSLHLNAALRWSFNRILSLEMDLAHESREVDFMAAEEEISLGSIELLPVNLMLQYHPFLSRWRPYIGAGINYTLFWEKSGELNRKKLAPSLGPVLQLGVDLPLRTDVILNFDMKFLFMETDFEGPVKETVKMSIDPTTLGLGLGFRF